MGDAYEEQIDGFHRELDKLRVRLATAERDLEEAQRDAVAETIRREAAERERDEAIAACQQTHGVHPSWVLAVEKMQKERDEAVVWQKAKQEWIDVATRRMQAQLDATAKLTLERDEARGKLAVAEDGLERAAQHARSAVKSWEAGQEHTVTHVRDAENAALVCEGVLARIRGDKR